MGDTGSMFIGYMLAAISILALLKCCYNSFDCASHSFRFADYGYCVCIYFRYHGRPIFSG
ncbi:MAG: hypothetical protein ACLR2G_07020 [Phascolarctobacterium faecium]